MSKPMDGVGDAIISVIAGAATAGATTAEAGNRRTLSEGFIRIAKALFPWCALGGSDLFLSSMTAHGSSHFPLTLSPPGPDPVEPTS